MHLSTHPTSYPTRYQEIAAKLEQELRQHYRCGDYLPAEQQLAARFEVNRHTLRRAIDQLVEKGWVQRRQGVGVLVLSAVSGIKTVRVEGSGSCSIMELPAEQDINEVYRVVC